MIGCYVNFSPADAERKSVRGSMNTSILQTHILQIEQSASPASRLAAAGTPLAPGPAIAYSSVLRLVSPLTFGDDTIT